MSSADPFQSATKNTVDVWRIDLEPANPPAGREETLSPAERATAARFRFEHDRLHYLAAHTAMRAILSGYLGCSPRQVAFQPGNHGKPALIGGEWFFNLTHSGQLALLAVTRQEAVGVDVELHRPLDDIQLLASQCFSPREYRQFRSLPAVFQMHGFFNAWTRKEAYIKALGEGLSHPLQQFSVTLIPGQRCRLLEVTGEPQEAQSWTLEALDVGSDYSAALAIRAEDVSIRCWNYRLEQERNYVRR